MEINFLPKQLEAWETWNNPQINELGYGGAAGGGKTRLGCYFGIVGTQQYPGSRFGIGRKELKTLRLTTMATLFEVMAELGFKKELDYRFNAQDNVLTFTNSSQIYFLDTAYSPQDPEYTRFGSLELTWCWVDESNETPEKAKIILKTRVGRKNVIAGENIKPFWLETFNPNKGHVYNDYYKPWKENTLPEYRRFIRALPGDNPLLPDAYIEQLKRSDKITKERLLLGNFEYDSDDRALVSYDYITDLFNNSVPVSEQKYLTADIARYGKDKTVIGLWEGLKLTEIVVLEKSSIPNTSEKIRSLARQNNIPYPHCVIDEDGVGGGVVDLNYGMKGFTANSSPIEVKSKRQNFRNLKSQCGFTLADYINEHKIAITQQSVEIKEKILQEIEATLKQKTVDNDLRLELISKDEVKEIIGRSPDFADMILMRMFLELNHMTTAKVTISRPNYKPYGYQNNQQLNKHNPYAKWN